MVIRATVIADLTVVFDGVARTVTDENGMEKRIISKADFITVVNGAESPEGQTHYTDLYPSTR